jgi:multidrug efflux pump subunit AcrB
MTARFFIDRPVTAAVLSLVIVLMGSVSLRLLPVCQYPNILPPQVSVTARFPGADAQTMSQSVAAPLERAINGVDGMIYLQSLNSDGQMQLSVSFEVGTDPDIDTINVSGRVQSVLSSLPQDVQRLGVTVQKQQDSLIAILALNTTSSYYNDVAISNSAVAGK